MLTTKTANTVNADIIIPLYPVGRICLFSNTTKEIERSAAIESDDIRVAFAISLAAVDRLELIPICVPRPEKIRMLTTKTANTVSADIIIPLYPVGRICLLSNTTKEIERSAAIESDDIRVAFAISLAAVDRFGKIIWKFSNKPTGTRMITSTRTNTEKYSPMNAPTGPICLTFRPISVSEVPSVTSLFPYVAGGEDLLSS